jgi:formyltetrahydrofolate deformylase
VLEPYQPDYLVLAKYMRILSGGFVARYRQRIINIHHSFLPAFAAAQPCRQAYERRPFLANRSGHG